MSATTARRPARRRRVERETTDYAAGVRRMIRAHGRRVADGDPEDLAELLGLRAEIDAAAQVAVDGMRANHGRTWTEIAAALGITRQSAQERWSKRT